MENVSMTNSLPHKRINEKRRPFYFFPYKLLGADQQHHSDSACVRWCFLLSALQPLEEMCQKSVFDLLLLFREGVRKEKSVLGGYHAGRGDMNM